MYVPPEGSTRVLTVVEDQVAYGHLIRVVDDVLIVGDAGWGVVLHLLDLSQGQRRPERQASVVV